MTDFFFLMFDLSDLQGRKNGDSDSSFKMSLFK